eukprot:m.91022 g.91022  ORF g.91022 m.91022 type:complete len:147 (+) comp16485_c0_seq2:1062-1502(+)
MMTSISSTEDNKHAHSTESDKYIHTFSRGIHTFSRTHMEILITTNLNFIFTVNDIDQVAECNAVHTVACSANLTVDFVSSADAAVIKGVEVALMIPTIVRWVEGFFLCHQWNRLSIGKCSTGTSGCNANGTSKSFPVWDGFTGTDG